MIDIKRTTLVPSLRALTAFKSHGQLDPLMHEYTAERSAIAAAIDRPDSEVIVDLSQGAMAATVHDLDQARSVPAAKKRLLNAHAIQSTPTTVATYRTLDASAVGLDRRESSLWLWFATPDVEGELAAFLTLRSIHFERPFAYDWPVTDAIAVISPPTKALLRGFAAAFTMIDVDHNGRPFP